jgi:hypothetical protein
MPDEDGYTMEDMEKWKEKSDANIARLEEGIAQEREAKRRAQIIIDDLKAKAESDSSE